ncbi:MAG: PHB depolymerase family esterase [Bacteroidota bacterium]
MPRLLIAFLLFALVAGCGQTLPIGEQRAYTLTHGDQTSGYLLYLPEAYEETPDTTRWPLMLFLHGAGERGTNINQVTVNGPPKQLQAGQQMPFIVVSPQSPPNQFWGDQIEWLDALLREVTDTYRVDLDRVYVTGLSMGGFGTWSLATAYPDRFAALAPICGGGDANTVCALRHIPTWVFHGDADEVVPPERSQVMVDSLQACNGNVQFTLYPGVGHDSWTPTYNDPRLYEWLLAQRRPDGTP